MLGGLLTFANVIKGPHENLDDLRKYLIRQQELKGVKVVTGTEVTREMIEQEAPDYVVLAVGGKRPELELSSNGATTVISLDDIATQPPRSATMSPLSEEMHRRSMRHSI